jgi:alcohol oxidase
VIVDATVVRVFFDNDNRAQGIEYYENKSREMVGRIKAKRQVIVSCGALGTPQVLERSGIGSKQLLDRLNIRVVSDLPGVGENYQDHQRIVTPYKTSLKPGETMDEFLRGGLNITKAKREQDPILGFNALNFAGKVRPSEEELAKLGAPVQEAWEKDYKDQPLKPFAIIAELQA